MGEVAIAVLKWASRFTFVFAAIVAFVVLLNLATSILFLGVNAGALSDIIAIVSVWSPFNMNVLFLWIGSASLAYMTYRLALTALIWLNRFIGA